MNNNIKISNRNIYSNDLEKQYNILRGEYYRQGKLLEYYKSGEAFEALNKKHDKQIKSLEYKLEVSKRELSKQKDKSIKDKERIDNLKEIVIDKEKEFNKLYDEYQKKISEYEKLIKEMEIKINDLEGTNKKLTAQINRDFTNSSIPSSECRNRKTICNSREPSNRKQGGQVGHKAHLRKKYIPDTVIELDIPKEVKDNPSLYKDTQIVKSRDLVDMKVVVNVTRYNSKVYENIVDHSEVFTPFPKGIDNETNYGEGVKALCLLLNSYGNMSIRKTSEVLNYISDENISLSIGAIASLTKHFSNKCKQDIKDIVSNLYLSSYMHTDATYIRNNGKQEYVFVSSNGKDTLYQHFNTKGKEAIEQTPVKDYEFTLVHDHDKTYFNYGGSHQKCLAHEVRYVENSIINEPNLTWNKNMKKLLQTTIHEFKNNELDNEKIKEIKKRYDEIINDGLKEYEEHPPTKYYVDGYNTFNRMKDFKDSILYFLDHENVPYTNNCAELRLRKIKRKHRQVGSFRSPDSINYYCDFMSVIESCKAHGENIYQVIKSRV